MAVSAVATAGWQPRRGPICGRRRQLKCEELPRGQLAPPLALGPCSKAMSWAAEATTERQPEASCADLQAMLRTVRKNGRAIRFASPELRSDRRLVLEAVRQTGHALEYASLDLRHDRDVVMAAVRTSGLALQFAGEPLRKDREVVLEAVRESGWALQFAALELQEDKQFGADGHHWVTGGY